VFVYSIWTTDQGCEIRGIPCTKWWAPLWSPRRLVDGVDYTAWWMHTSPENWYASVPL